MQHPKSRNRYLSTAQKDGIRSTDSNFAPKSNRTVNRTLIFWSLKAICYIGFLRPTTSFNPLVASSNLARPNSYTKASREI